MERPCSPSIASTSPAMLLATQGPACQGAPPRCAPVPISLQRPRRARRPWTPTRSLPPPPCRPWISIHSSAAPTSCCWAPPRGRSLRATAGGSRPRPAAAAAGRLRLRRRRCRPRSGNHPTEAAQGRRLHRCKPPRRFRPPKTAFPPACRPTTAASSLSCVCHGIPRLTLASETGALACFPRMCGRLSSRRPSPLVNLHRLRCCRCDPRCSCWDRLTAPSPFVRC